MYHEDLNYISFMWQALKSDMDEWDWSNISSLCDLCVHFGISSSEYEITVECISMYMSAYFSKEVGHAVFCYTDYTISCILFS